MDEKTRELLEHIDSLINEGSEDRQTLYDALEEAARWIRSHA